MLDGVLLLKLTLAPLLVLGASLVRNRWGPAVGGWIISLPLTSAPVVLILALERGNTFAAETSIGVILGLVSQSAFVLIYCWLLLRSRLPWYASLPLGWCVFLASTLLLRYIQTTIWLAFLGFTVILALVVKSIPRLNEEETLTPSNGAWWDIPARMLAAATLVFLITESAVILGPLLSGLLTPFPVYTSVLAGSEHRNRGAESTVRLVRGAAVGFFTPGFFFLIVGVSLPVLGLASSFGLAIIASLILHGLLLNLV
jgi:hypothetical protein